jgi:hypothetical protein
MAVAWAASMAAACNAVLGIESLPPSQTFSHASEDCARCVAATCATEEAACRLDAGCLDSYACHAACTPDDWHCRDACRQATASAGLAFETMDACARRDCVAECYANGAGLELYRPGCSECTFNQCGADFRACVTSADCEEIVMCAFRAQPYNPDRMFECYGPTLGEGAAFELGTCSSTVVCPSCDFGEDFGCVGQYAWSEADTALTSVRYRFGLVELSGAPIDLAFTVDVCKALDCGMGPDGHCARPIASATSAGGAVDIDLEFGIYGFNGCLHIHGQPEWVPTIFYFGRPIVREEEVIGATLVKRTELDGILNALGRNAEPGTGHVAAAVWDCVTIGARGAVLDPVAGVDPIYLAANGPSASATETDARGGALFLNVAAGDDYDVRANRADGGGPIGSHRVRVRSGWITEVYVYPATAGEAR